jgi:hypothetical protein
LGEVGIRGVAGNDVLNGGGKKSLNSAEAEAKGVGWGF